MTTNRSKQYANIAAYTKNLYNNPLYVKEMLHDIPNSDHETLHDKLLIKFCRMSLRKETH